jgi:predicted RND superfamily exporter protein
MKLETVFESIAKFNFKNRAIVIIASIAVTLVCSIGLLNLKMETDPQ